MKGKIHPIKSRSDVDRIRDILKDKSRDLLFFDLATRTGLDIKQILNIRVRDLLGCKVGSRLVLPQPEGKPPCFFVVSKTVHRSWEKYLKEAAPSPDDYLIKSQKNALPPTLSSVSHMVNKWFKDANIAEVRGAKSLKRTWQTYFKPEQEGGGSSEQTGKSAQSYGLSPVMDPVGPISTLQETVHETLFQAIISGRIPPGQKLVIDKVAGQMKVSRIPVREAFHRLREAGLISIDKWKGAIVNQLSVENLREITKIRLMLESEAANHAALNCKDETLERLEQIHEKWKQSIDQLNLNDLQSVESYLKLNRLFHNSIYREANMPILFQIINGLWDRVSPYLHILVAGRIKGAVSEETVRIHEGMLAGMMARSGGDVSVWLKEDLIRAEESIIQFLYLDGDARSERFLMTSE